MTEDKADEKQLGTLAKRMLAMPPKSRDELVKKSNKTRGAQRKRTNGKGRARVGKSKR